MFSVVFQKYYLMHLAFTNSVILHKPHLVCAGVQLLSWSVTPVEVSCFVIGVVTLMMGTLE